MFQPLSLFIGLRYTRAKRRNHFISFIALTSMLGIALGVLVLITVLSVMNGFDREIKKRVFGMVPPITVTSSVGYVTDWQTVVDVLHKFPAVTRVAPIVTQQVLLTHSGYVQPVMVNGIFPDEEKNISILPSKMIEGSLSDLQEGKFGIVLGEDLASRLSANVGDKVTVVTPMVSVSVAGVIPRSKRFTVVGVFRVGSGFGFDMNLAFINMVDAQKVFEMGTAVTAIRTGIKDVFDVNRISEQLAAYLGPNAHVSNWTDQFGAFFSAVSLEKRMMFFILLLIVAVAVFNLVSTLVMAVNDKESDIAILRTFGATPAMIMRIFIVQGAVIGITGTVLGVVGGIVLALNVTEIVKLIEHVFHVQFLSSSVYFVDYLPSELEWMDVVRISLSALFLSLIATLYPAWQASRMEPVEALRYE